MHRTPKTLCLPHALVEVRGCTREEQERNMKQDHWAPRDQKRVRSQRFWEFGNWERTASLRCLLRVFPLLAAEPGWAEDIQRLVQFLKRFFQRRRPFFPSC